VAVVVQVGLDQIPGRLVDQSLMLAFVELSLVIDEARVQRIGEEHVDGLLDERLAASFTPGFRLPLLGAPVEAFEFVHHRHQGVVP
jgi:hypothetical protein